MGIICCNENNERKGQSDIGKKIPINIKQKNQEPNPINNHEQIPIDNEEQILNNNQDPKKIPEQYPTKPSIEYSKQLEDYMMKKTQIQKYLSRNIEDSSDENFKELKLFENEELSRFVNDK